MNEVYTLWPRNSTSYNLSSGERVCGLGGLASVIRSLDELALTFQFFSCLFTLIFYCTSLSLTSTYPSAFFCLSLLICMLWNVLPPLFRWQPPVLHFLLFHSSPAVSLKPWAVSWAGSKQMYIKPLLDWGSGFGQRPQEGTENISLLVAQEQVSEFLIRDQRL